MNGLDEQPDDVMDAETVKTEFFGQCGCNERGHDADCPLLTSVEKSPHDRTNDDDEMRQLARPEPRGWVGTALLERDYAAGRNATRLCGGCGHPITSHYGRGWRCSATVDTRPSGTVGDTPTRCKCQGFREPKERTS